MRLLVASVFAVTIAAVSVTTAQTVSTPPPPAPSPQEVPPKAAQPEPPLLTGHYQALDFWKKLKLGSAYYANPEAVRRVQFVYAFDPKDFVADGKSAEIWSLAKTGHVTFGIAAAGGTVIQSVAVSDLPQGYKIESQADLKKLLASDEVSVIAGTDSLLGTSAMITLYRSNLK